MQSPHSETKNHTHKMPAVAVRETIIITKPHVCFTECKVPAFILFHLSFTAGPSGKWGFLTPFYQ